MRLRIILYRLCHFLLTFLYLTLTLSHDLRSNYSFAVLRVGGCQTKHEPIRISKFLCF